MGTSLLDFDPNLAAFKEWQARQGTGAHMLPPVVTSAPRTKGLPPMVTTAPATLRPHLLAAAHSVAPPMPDQGADRFSSGETNSFASNLPVEQTPSAVSTLLQGLLAPPAPMPGATQQGAPGAGPAQMPGPQASPMPMQAPPKAPPSMMDRVRGHLDSILGLDAPQGYEGLLSPEEIKAAKPSRLRALIGGPDALSPEHQYEERLNHILQLHQLAAGVNDHARVMNARQQMSTLFAPSDNETEDQTRQRLAKMYAFAMSHGDEETMKDVGSTLRGIMTAPKSDPAKVLAPGGALVDKEGKLLYSNPMASADKASDYTQYVDGQGNVHVLKKDQEPPKGWKTVPMNTTEVRVDASNQHFDQGRIDKAVKDYTGQIKPLRERAAVIDQALKTLDDAAHNPNPNVRKTLYTSAVANFIQAADQKAQIRYQLLQYFKQNVDPSIAGKWEVLKNRLINGTLPGYTMEGMIGHLKNLRDLTQGEVEQQRRGLVKRRPELEDALPQTSEFFADPASATPTAGYSPNNPFAKKKP